MGIPSDPVAVVAEFTRASAEDDNERLRELLAPGLVLWHNFSGASLDLTRMMQFRTTLRQSVATVEMRPRITRTPTGCIRENVAIGRTRGDRSYRVAYCVYFEFDGSGRISRMTEYYDSAQFGPLVGEGWNPFV